MKTSPDSVRNIYRRKLYYGDNGEVYAQASGKTAQLLARVHGPTDEQIRKLMLQIRRKQNWSQASLAAVMGAPKNTVRKWEEGARRPSWAAKKLIWTIHALVFAPQALLDDWEYFVTWGATGPGKSLIVPDGSDSGEGA